MGTAVIREFPIFGNYAIKAAMQDPDHLIAKNLKRLRMAKGLSQAELGRLLGGMDKDKISGYETGNIPMGKGMLMRFCKALNIELWEFYWTEKTPVIRDQKEQEALSCFREAEDLRVAEDFMRYGRYRIEEAKRVRAGSVDERLQRGREVLKKRHLKKKAG